MVVAMILRGNRIEIAAYKSHLASSFVKRISLEVGESLIKNGKILSSHFLGKVIGAELKKNRISSGELVVAVKSKDILMEKIYLATCDKALALQHANEVLEANQPGILDKNDIICKKYYEQNGRMCLNIAIVPKILIAQHRTLAKAMKCRLGKLISYVDCMDKLDIKDHLKLWDKQELYPDLDKSLLDVLILDHQKQDNLLNVSGRQEGKVKRVNIPQAALLTVAGAVSVFLIILFAAIFGSSSNAGQKTSVNFDYRMIQDVMEEIMNQGQSRLTYVSFDSDGTLKVEAATGAPSNIHTVTGKMEEAGLEEVELVQVQLVKEQEAPILYTISAKYAVRAAQWEQ